MDGFTPWPWSPTLLPPQLLPIQAPQPPYCLALNSPPLGLSNLYLSSFRDSLERFGSLHYLESPYVEVLDILGVNFLPTSRTIRVDSLG